MSPVDPPKVASDLLEANSGWLPISAEEIDRISGTGATRKLLGGTLASRGVLAWKKSYGGKSKYFSYVFLLPGDTHAVYGAKRLSERLNVPSAAGVKKTYPQVAAPPALETIDFGKLGIDMNAAETARRVDGHNKKRKVFPPTPAHCPVAETRHRHNFHALTSATAS